MSPRNTTRKILAATASLLRPVPLDLGWPRGKFTILLFLASANTGKLSCGNERQTNDAEHGGAAPPHLELRNRRMNAALTRSLGSVYFVLLEDHPGADPIVSEWIGKSS
jgi:hypothetical protein